MGRFRRNAVTSAEIIADAVITAKVADSAVTTAKIASDAVTTAKITDAAVTTAKLASGTLFTRRINSYTWHPHSSQAFVAGRVLLEPIIIPFTVTVEAIAFVIFTQNGNVRVGIYPSSSDKPDALNALVDSGSVAVETTANSPQEIAITATQLTAGLYYLALEADNAVAAFASINNTVETNAGAVRQRYYDRAGGYGAFTSPCPVTATTNLGPSMYALISSVP